MQRHVRILLRRAGEVPPYVAPVFAPQRVGVVFRMTLQEEERIPLAAGKQIGAGFGRISQNFVSGIAQRIDRRFIPSRMRYLDRRGQR